MKNIINTSQLADALPEFVCQITCHDTRPMYLPRIKMNFDRVTSINYKIIETINWIEITTRNN